MADESEDIRKAFKTMFQRNIPLHCGCYEVESVQGKSCTIYVDEDKQLKVDGILLGFDKSGFIAYPKLGSDVWVIFSDSTQTNGAVVMVEKTAHADVMGDEFGGLIKIEQLVNKVNNIENKLNGLIAKFNGHTHVVNVTTSCGAGAGTGAGTTTTTGTPEVGTLQPTTRQDIENEKVKHGKG